MGFAIMDMTFTQWAALPRSGSGADGAATLLESLPSGLRDELTRGGDFWANLLDHLRELHPELPEDLDPEGLLALLGQPAAGADQEAAGLLMGLMAPVDGDGSPEGGILPLKGESLPSGWGEEDLSGKEDPQALLLQLLAQRLPASAAQNQDGSASGRTDAGWQQTLLMRAVAGQEPALLKGEDGGRGLRLAEVLNAPATSALGDGGLQPASMSLLQSHGAAPRPLGLEVPVPVSQPNWNEAVGNRVLWMVNQNVQGAELKLNPPQLGPLEVRISMEGDRAHLQFMAHHPATREALDAAIPRLRELFADNGVDLGNVDVSHREAQGGEARSGKGEGGAGNPGAGGGEGGGVDPNPMNHGPSSDRDTGLLDAYA